MEYDLVNRPHLHSLLFEEEGKFIGDAAVCARCCLPLDSPSFGCFVCKFHIHQYCLHLPPQIHTPFHPHPLIPMNSYNPLICSVCSRSLPGEVYFCVECRRFQIDIKCIIADTKASALWQSGKYIVHFSHPHPLALSTLEEQEARSRGGIINKDDVFCLVCQLPLPIKSGSCYYYFCPQCEGTYFHEECAELPLELHNSVYHPHPLFLGFAREDHMLCNSCRNFCTGFVYSCVSCKFVVHVRCLKSINHIHTITNILRNKIDLKCQVCGNRFDDTFPWICDICHILVHKKCAAFPSKLRITEHTHDLTFNYDCDPFNGNKIILCQLCGVKMVNMYSRYGCSECNYFTHLECAQSSSAHPPQLTSVDSTQNNDKLCDEKEIQHFSHPHKYLTCFFPQENEKIMKDRVCDGCMKCLSDSGPSYGCDDQDCDFFLHQECVKLPNRIETHPLLHPHLLTLISIPDFVFQCEACLQHFQGFAYRCEKCLCAFDIQCASIQNLFNHPNHQHPLYLSKTKESTDNVLKPIGRTYKGPEACEACGKKVKDELRFGCIQCQFYLHIKCAMLPVVVRYRFDPHPLNLTFVEEERKDHYVCDICEEERESWLWFYSCQKCSFAAHSRCALGEFPYVKSRMHKAHRHPLSLVMMKLEKGEGGAGVCVCAACKKSCTGNLAFQCAACNFNVHAIGHCYNLQILDKKSSFTNRNVFSRANQLYDHPIHQNLESDPWKEMVFSTIRAFVVYHDGKNIRSIKIQYAKNGAFVWSNTYGEKNGTKTEVSFDYPDEYLVSIHGFHGSNHICSLTLQTNRKTYGPFGVETEVKFSSVKEGVKTIGIFGTSGGYKIDSIGFYGVSTVE